jgi:hypothetical protein
MVGMLMVVRLTLQPPARTSEAKPVPVDTEKDPVEAVPPEPLEDEEVLPLVDLPDTPVLARGGTMDVVPPTLCRTLRRGSLPVGEPRMVPPN